MSGAHFSSSKKYIHCQFYCLGLAASSWGPGTLLEGTRKQEDWGRGGQGQLPLKLRPLYKTSENSCRRCSEEKSKVGSQCFGDLSGKHLIPRLPANIGYSSSIVHRNQGPPTPLEE